MSACECGSGRAYEACCGPYHEGWEQPPTAEALMRSRYTAYARAAAAGQGTSAFVDWIESTSGGAAAASFSRRDVTAWIHAATFTGLEIQATERGGPDDDDGVVEFVATYTEASKPRVLRERSLFRREGGAWRYVGAAKGETVTRTTPRVGRNDPCPCGSGQKYKKCHGA